MRQLFVALIAILSLASQSFAAEPRNLALIKQDLIRYHDSGEYEKDMNAVVTKAIRYLSYRLTQKHHHLKPAIVIDIDETALSNYPNLLKLGFGGTLDEIRTAEKEGMDPAITPVLNLYHFAKRNNIPVFFITGRFDEERETTERNLKNVGYDNWARLILKPVAYQNAKASVYKTAMRKQLVAEGYDIWLNIGDQQSDLVGKFADKTFKLPNPYYIIP